MQPKQKLKKKDFIEIKYTGKVKDGDIFDTNIEEDAKKINLDIKTRPLIICIGENMILPAIDEFLEGKEIGEKYTLELSPEKAFGSRKREMIKIIPSSKFKEQNMPPHPGMVFQFDNLIGKITAVSGGRVIVDFNNPIAGKDVVYDIKIEKLITEQNEKVKALMQIFFRKDFQFKIETKKLVIEAEKGFEKFIEIFKPKFKEILDLDLEIKTKEKPINKK
ncbi:MAG: peptidylprolyl isomerase [Nanoarchaeota archaeon]|nr:peptidylprolyl isomerase [Nanoarchaeota archaeon]